MNDTKYKIKVMQAFEDGKKVRFRKGERDDFEVIEFSNPIWDWDTFEYEIVPKPKVIYVNEYETDIIAYISKEAAKENASSPLRIAVKYMEVIGD